MNSLYEIKQDLLNIFSDIENNDGEVDDEEYDKLLIKKDELYDKLNDYYKAIAVWKKDAESCKTEKERIVNTQKKFENRIKRLKAAVLEAVEEFGEQGKTNRYIELPTVRLSTKCTESVNIDQYRVSVFIRQFERYIRELISNGILECGENISLIGILDAINANVKAEYGDNFIPFTISDLYTIKLQINTTMTIKELFERGANVLNQYWKTTDSCEILDTTSKSDWRLAVGIATARKMPLPTMATIEHNNSLLIK